jgi:hypothetical protein
MNENKMAKCERKTKMDENKMLCSFLFPKIQTIEFAFTFLRNKKESKSKKVDKNEFKPETTLFY